MEKLDFIWEDAKTVCCAPKANNPGRWPTPPEPLQNSVFMAAQSEGWEGRVWGHRRTRHVHCQCAEDPPLLCFLTSVPIKYLKHFFHFSPKETTPAQAPSGPPRDAATTYLPWALFELIFCELALQLEEQESILHMRADFKDAKKMMQMCHYKSSQHSYDFPVSKVSWSLANALKLLGDGIMSLSVFYKSKM